MMYNHNKRNARRKITAAIALAALLAAVGTSAGPALSATGGSLWSDSSDSMFVDGKAHYLGDIVTIIINESTTGVNSSSTDVSQTEKMDAGTGTGVIGQFLQAFGIEAQDAYKGGGTTTSKGTLNTTVSAVVAEVLENGNLVIEARRSMVVNEETQTVVLSGVIRPRDVARDNTVPSSRIANAQIKYTGRGPIAKRQRAGILNKLFDWIF